MKRMIAGLALVAMLVVFAGGCAPISAVINTETAAHIGFSTGSLFDESEEIFFTRQELAEKPIESSVYRSTLHFDALSYDEQLVYHALEYAMENGYTNILVDDLIAANAEELVKVLEYLSLDSPLLEQNLRFEIGNFSTYISVPVFDFYEHQTEFTGFYITVDNFEQTFWDKKQKALEKAIKITEDLPTDADEAEKAEELYRYIADTVTYNDKKYSEPDAVYPYLYDALFEGETHCDGYTNALSLLYRLADIECVEKVYNIDNDKDEPSEDKDEKTTEDEVGHTWNFARIGEKWYNIDGTGEDMIPLKDTDLHAGLCFGYGDILQGYTPDYADLYPKAEENLYVTIDAHLPDVDSQKFINEVETAYGLHDDQWTLILLDSYDEDKAKDQLQVVADDLQLDFYYVTFELIEERTALFICDRDLCDKSVFDKKQ